MATCDIQTLVNQAACLGCMPVAQLQAIKTDLLCDYLVNPPNPPCTNLIPDGAVYSDVYTLNLVVGASYTITFGVNETGLYNGATEILNPHTSTPVTFIASGDGIFLIPSTNFSRVTAIVCGPICVNLIPEGAAYTDGSYVLLPGILESGHSYMLTWGVNEQSLDTTSDTINSTGPGSTITFTASESGYTLISSQFGDVVPLTATICAVPAAFIFTSIVPNSLSHLNAIFGTLSGSGFTLSGITNFQADDGMGHVFQFAITPSTDNVIFLTGGPLTPAATYTLYYSTNSGATWTTAGLTITSS